MKLFVKRDRGFLEIPEEFAVLEKITEDSKFRYSITYQVDPVKAIQENALKVLIHISSKPYMKKTNPIFVNANNSNENLILNILQKKSKQKDTIRQQKDEYILSYISDITAKIPNNLIGQLKNTNIKQNIPIKKFKEISTSPVEPLNSGNYNLPILEMNLNKVEADLSSKNTTENTQALKTIANNLLYNKGIDPANVLGEKTNTLISAKQVFSGTIPKKPFYNKKEIKNNTEATSLVQNFINRTNLTSQLELSSKDFINILTNKEQNFVEITETIDIPVSAIIDNEFYVVFELQNSKTTVELESFHVNHGKNLVSLKIPTEPPSVIDLGINRPGKVLLQVKQEDENAIAINVYKKELKPALSVTDSVYNFVGKIDLNKNQGYQRFEDIAASFYPIIYRFIPVNADNLQSSVFTSKVIQFDSAGIKKNIKSKRKQFFVGFNSEIGNQSINIEITNIPSGPIAIKLLKRNKIGSKENYEQVGDIIAVQGNTNNSIFIEDYNVKINRIYEYICELYYKDGTVEKSANNLIVEYKPITNNILSIELMNANIVESEQNYDATFTIKWQYISNDFELVKKLLVEQNLISEFNQDVFDNRENLNKLFAFSVIRTNITTNEVDSFGIIDSLQFSDLKYGKSKGIVPVKPGFDYRYTVTAYLRNPETLLPKLQRTVEINKNISYTFSPFKWRHPLTLSLGNIVNSRTLISNHAKNDFTFGNIVEIKSVNLSLADVLPTISDAKATRLRKDQILLQWKILGNVGKIDHFVITLNLLEMQTIIGKAHNISNTNYFQFLDVLTNGEKGGLTYSITPIYFDYNPGTSVKTNLVII